MLIYPTNQQQSMVFQKITCSVKYSVSFRIAL